MSAGQKFPWILDWRGLPGRVPGAAEVLSLVFCWRPPVCAGGVLAEKWKPSLAEVLSLGLGLSGVFGGPELAGTPAQHMCSRCECAHGLCRRSSKLGFWFVAPCFERNQA